MSNVDNELFAIIASLPETELFLEHFLLYVNIEKKMLNEDFEIVQW